MTASLITLAHGEAVHAQRLERRGRRLPPIGAHR